MHKRVVDVRKQFNLTQGEFAAKLGLTRNFISLIENGNRDPSDRTISDICREFNVNEHWLRTGEGEMFNPVSRDREIEAFLNELLKAENSDFRRRLVAVLAKLDPKEWQMLEQLARRLAADQAEEKPNIHVIKKVGRDGSMEELHLTDEELERFKDWKNGLDRPGDEI